MSISCRCWRFLTCVLTSFVLIEVSAVVDISTISVTLAFVAVLIWMIETKLTSKRRRRRSLSHSPSLYFVCGYVGLSLWCVHVQLTLSPLRNFCLALSVSSIFFSLTLNKRISAHDQHKQTHTYTHTFQL